MRLHLPYRKECPHITDRSKQVHTFSVQLIHRPGSLQCCQEKRARKDRTASDRRRTHADLYQFTGYGEYSISAGVGDKGTCRPVPIIRRDMQSFMRMLLALKQPKRILEVGTAVGFSTLLMCEYGPEDMEIVTIENYEKRIPVAKDNFRRAGRESQITLLEGDAGEILKNLTGTFDMIFMDAAKGQYIHWLPDVLRLMKEGSVLVSDNVLQEGDIIESHYLVERRNRYNL